MEVAGRCSLSLSLFLCVFRLPCLRPFPLFLYVFGLPCPRLFPHLSVGLRLPYQREAMLFVAAYPTGTRFIISSGTGPLTHSLQMSQELFASTENNTRAGEGEHVRDTVPALRGVLFPYRFPLALGND